MYVIILAVDGRWLWNWKRSHFFQPKHYIEIVNGAQPARMSHSSSSSSPGGWRTAAASGQSAVIIYTPADLSDLQTMNWADIQHRASIQSTLYRRTLLSLTSIGCQIDIATGRRRLTTSNWRQFDVPVLSGTVVLKHGGALGIEGQAEQLITNAKH